MPNWYLNRWRLATLAVGISLLIYGKFTFPAPDWDVGCSVFMALATYIMVPYFTRGLKNCDLVLIVIPPMVCADYSYVFYWGVLDNPLISREANFMTSFVLFLSCFTVWELVPEVAKGIRKSFPYPKIARANFLQRSGSSGLDDTECLSQRVCGSCERQGNRVKGLVGDQFASERTVLRGSQSELIR